MTGLDKARETAEKIKRDSMAEKALAVKNTNLPTADLDEDTLAFLYENAGAGIDDIPMFSALPGLRVHSRNSENNQLANGSDPNIGQLYYSGNKEAYNEVVVHLLVIRRALMPQYDKPGLKRNYLIAGIIDEDNAPFVMYVKGMSYRQVWELQEQIHPFVKGKNAIPLFALKIRLFTEKEKPQDPKFPVQHVLKYKLLMDDKGFPQIETSRERLEWLKEGVETSGQALEELISAKGQPDTGNTQIDEAGKPIQEAQDVADEIDAGYEASVSSSDEDISDDVPF